MQMNNDKKIILEELYWMVLRFWYIIFVFISLEYYAWFMYIVVKIKFGNRLHRVLAYWIFLSSHIAVIWNFQNRSSSLLCKLFGIQSIWLTLFYKYLLEYWLMGFIPGTTLTLKNMVGGCVNSSVRRSSFIFDRVKFSTSKFSLQTVF